MNIFRCWVCGKDQDLTSGDYEEIICGNCFRTISTAELQALRERRLDRMIEHDIDFQKHGE